MKINVPEMTTTEARSSVLEIVRKLPSVKSASNTVDTCDIVVTYNSLGTSLKNIEFAIAEAGYQANNVPANPEKIKRPNER